MMTGGGGRFHHVLGLGLVIYNIVCCLVRQ